MTENQAKAFGPGPQQATRIGERSDVTSWTSLGDTSGAVFDVITGAGTATSLGGTDREKRQTTEGRFLPHVSKMAARAKMTGSSAHVTSSP